MVLLPEANMLAEMEEVWQMFCRVAAKYKQEYKKVPVLIIDNANRLAEKQIGLLEKLQDYAKRAIDERIATVVFVSSEGRVPRRMIGMLVFFVAESRPFRLNIYTRFEFGKHESVGLYRLIDLTAKSGYMDRQVGHKSISNRSVLIR